LVCCCGVTAETFCYIYHAYCGSGSPINHPMKLYHLLLYYKIYPTKRQYLLYFHNHGNRYGRYQQSLVSLAEYLSGRLDELSNAWTKRQAPDNRLPHIFGSQVTGCVDSFPIYVCRPDDIDWQHALYNGKYKAHILKVQLVCDHHGTPIWYSGPHIGTTHDTTVYKENPPPLIDNEQLLGDKGYQGCGSSVIVPYKKRHREVRIEGDKRAFNIVHRWYRATVEHSIGYLKRFRILDGMYRGKLKNGIKEIQLALNIIIHISAIHLIGHPHRTHHPLLHSDSDDSADSDDDTAAEVPPISHPLSSYSDPNEHKYDSDPNEHKYDYDSDTWDPSEGTGLEAGHFRRGTAVFHMVVRRMVASHYHTCQYRNQQSQCKVLWGRGYCKKCLA